MKNPMPATRSVGTETPADTPASGAEGITFEQLKHPTNHDITTISRLWIDTGLIPAIRDATQDIKNCVNADHGSLIVARSPDTQKIIATMMAGHDGRFGWIHYLAIARHMQGCGIGAGLVALAEDILRMFGLGEIRITIENATSADFYAKLGYEFADGDLGQDPLAPKPNKIMRKSLVK